MENDVLGGLLFVLMTAVVLCGIILLYSNYVSSDIAYQNSCYMKDIIIKDKYIIDSETAREVKEFFVVDTDNNSYKLRSSERDIFGEY